MRRVIGSIALGLGVALLVIGLAARPVIYDRLATVPLDQNSESISEGEGMTALRAWSPDETTARYDRLTGVTLRSTRTVKGIPGAVPVDQQDSNAFWQTGVLSEAVGIGDLTSSLEGVSFDRRTGEATNCCGDFKAVPADPENPLGDMVNEPIEHEGLFFKFPFGVEKSTYKWWDGDLGAPVDISFVREENVAGADTYVFEQTIPQTEVTTRDVPAAIFDTEATGNTPAKVMYGNTRTLWVEPATGVIIKGQEVLDRSFVSDLGTATTTKGTIGYTEETVRENAENWGSKGRLLGFVGGALMPVGIVVGLAMIAVGLLLLRTGSRPSPANRQRSGRRTGDGGVAAIFDPESEGRRART
ncbi:MAG TPA: DUF3068 domain-containing protein [Intrasporangium sp.]|nr:DUF3068 domain-containing protein [Intrasporangium sp.]